MIALGCFLLIVCLFGMAAYEVLTSMTKYPKTDRAKWPKNELLQCWGCAAPGRQGRCPICGSYSHEE
jgi:hypothetical protein